MERVVQVFFLVVLCFVAFEYFLPDPEPPYAIIDEFQVNVPELITEVAIKEDNLPNEESDEEKLKNAQPDKNVQKNAVDNGASNKDDNLKEETSQKGVWKDPRPDIYIRNDWNAICKYEWEKVSEFSFFHRHGVFYLVDLKMLVLLYVGYAGVLNDFEFSITILIDGKKEGTTVIQGDENWFEENFSATDTNITSYKIKVPFDILLRSKIHDESYLAELVRSKRVAIKVNIFDYDLHKGTETELDADVMYLRKQSTKKHSSMVCTKSYALDKKNVSKLEWWFELNKRMGFEKITLFNNSFEYDPSSPDGFEALFKRYAGFVEVIQMNCIPYYVVENNKTTGSMFINKYLHLPILPDMRASWTSLIIEMISLNICYMKNAQEYRHVAMMDTDEAFLPPLIEDQFYIHQSYDYVVNLPITNEFEATAPFTRLRCSRYTAPESDLAKVGTDWKYSGKIELYIHDIVRLDPKYKSMSSLHFNNAMQLSTESMSKIVAKFDEYFNGPRFNNSLPKHRITIPDTSIRSFQEKPANYRFEIVGQEEIKYAKNLVKIFKLYIQPYVKSLKASTEYFPQIYQRFFSIGSVKPFPGHVPKGKTIHNTMSTLDFSHHFPVVGPTYLDKWADSVLRVNHDMGQSSHFRLSHDLYDKEILSVRLLTFNYNYLNCFYKPILKDLSTQKNIKLPL